MKLPRGARLAQCVGVVSKRVPTDSAAENPKRGMVLVAGQRGAADDWIAEHISAPSIVCAPRKHTAGITPCLTKGARVVSRPVQDLDTQRI